MASAEEGVRRTLAAYCQLLDDGQLDAWSELFATDGVFVLPSDTVAGRSQILSYATSSFADARRRGKHLTTNSVIDVDGDTATARSDFLVLRRSRSGPAPLAAGRYDDVLVLDGGTWRFTRREAILPAAWQAAR